MSEQAQLVKSRQRVADHGEVFTPQWMVGDMLDLVKDESERIDARVLEPACGEGAFLQEILRRKLATVHARYGKNDFERRHYALLALMSTYGIELLADNAVVMLASRGRQLGRDENVTTAVLVRICKALDCQLPEIVELVPLPQASQQDN